MASQTRQLNGYSSKPMLPKISATTQALFAFPLSLMSRTNDETCTSLPALQVPILGKHGSYYSSNPTVEKVKKTKPKKLFGKTEKPTLLHLPPLIYPPKHEGYYNIMWDPHVRRGKPFVHFSDLEKQTLSCYERKLKQYNRENEKKDKDKDKEEINPLFGKGGTSKINYPSVKMPHKKELLDYSIFLEEQEEEDDSKFIDSVTQTEYIGDGPGDEEDAFAAHSSESNPTVDQPQQPSSTMISAPVPPPPRDHAQVKHAWKAGLEVGSQVNAFEIVKETQPFELNPRQITINRVSNIITSQLMYQSIQDTTQNEELDSIRNQCEQVAEWIAQDELSRYKEHRYICKRLAQEKEEADFVAAEEEEFKEATAKVGVNMFSQNYVKTIFERGFDDFQKDGIVGSSVRNNNTKNSGDPSEMGVEEEKNAKSTPVKTWLDTNVDIYFKNRKLDKSLVDDLIIDASTKRYEDHKSFLEQPNVSSSLKVERTSDAAEDTNDIDADNKEDIEDNVEDEADNDVDDDEDDDNDVDDVNDRDLDNEDDEDPKVIKLMENNPRFIYKEDN